MKAKIKISTQFFAFLMLFSFANLLVHNIIQLQCNESCEIHTKIDEESCHTKRVEKSCCELETAESMSMMDLADCNCDHSFEHTYVNTDNTINFNISFTIVEFEFPTIEEKYSSIYTPDIQTKYNSNEHTYKTTETYLI